MNVHADGGALAWMVETLREEWALLGGEGDEELHGLALSIYASRGHELTAAERETLVEQGRQLAREVASAEVVQAAEAAEADEAEAAEADDESAVKLPPFVDEVLCPFGLISLAAIEMTGREQK
jgi:hypothetical protein